MDLALGTLHLRPYVQEYAETRLRVKKKLKARVRYVHSVQNDGTHTVTNSRGRRLGPSRFDRAIPASQGGEKPMGAAPSERGLAAMPWLADGQ